MEQALSAAGFGLGPLTSSNALQPRLTPAVVVYYQQLLEYLATVQGPNGPDPTPIMAPISELMRKSSIRLRSLMPPLQGSNITTIIQTALVQLLQQHCTQRLRYGIGEVATLALNPAVIADFTTTLPLQVRRVSLGTTDSAELEDRCGDYQVGAVVNNIPPATTAMELLTGAALAELITESTRGPLDYALCLGEALVWWNQDFKRRPPTSL